MLAIIGQCRDSIRHRMAGSVGRHSTRQCGNSRRAKGDGVGIGLGTARGRYGTVGFSMWGSVVRTIWGMTCAVWTIGMARREREHTDDSPGQHRTVQDRVGRVGASRRLSGQQGRQRCTACDNVVNNMGRFGA